MHVITYRFRKSQVELREQIDQLADGTGYLTLHVYPWIVETHNVLSLSCDLAEMCLSAYLYAHVILTCRCTVP